MDLESLAGAGPDLWFSAGKTQFRFFAELLGYFICVRILLLLFLIFQRRL